VKSYQNSNAQSTTNKRTTTNITYNKQESNYNNNNQNYNRTYQAKEVEDDRPAFVPKEKEEEEELEEYPEYDGDDRVECHSCGRKFKDDVLPKHAKVCKKVFINKRKGFDTKKQRILDSEHATILKRAEFEEKKNKNKVGTKMANTGSLQGGNKKPKWQKQSEELRAIARANKTTSDFPQIGNKLGNKAGNKMGNTNYNNYKPSVITEDYSHCNMCNRKYNDNAYAKHLPTCERRTKEAALKGKANNALMPVSKTSGNNLGNNFPSLSSGSKPNFNVKFGKK